MTIYCVYLTSYYGLKMPPLYIGSTSYIRIESGYSGSVKSKEWKDIWKQELKEHPELFNTIILSRHYTRKEALEQELILQKLFNVVKSPLFINKAFASPNGFFGMNTSGENSPCYKISKTKEHKQKISKTLTGRILSEGHIENMSKSLNGLQRSKESRRNISLGKQGKNNPMYGLIGALSPNFGRRLYIHYITKECKKYIPGNEPNGFFLKHTNEVIKV